MIKEADLHPEGRKPGLFYGYVIVFAAFCIMVIVYGTYYTFGVFFEPVLAEFGWTRAMTSGAFSLSALLTGPFAIILGRLTDRLGPRITVVVCGLSLGLGHLLMSQINSVWQLYLFYGVMVGLSMGAGFVPLGSTVARWFTKRRGLMSGIFVSGIGAGTMIMPPIARLLISNYEWRVSYIIIGISVMVIIVGLAQLLKRDPSQMGLLPYGADDEVEKDSLDLQGEGFSLQEALCTTQLWIVWVIYFSLIFCVYTIMVHIVIHATGMGISAISAATVPAIIGGVSIAGRITIGSIADRIGNKPSMVIALTLVTAALFWLVVARDLWMLYLFAAVFGFAYGGLIAMESTIPAEMFGLGSHGAILGFVFFGTGLGGSVGPVLVGHIFDITGSYQLGFLICAVIGVLCIILALLLRPISRRGINHSKGNA